MFINVVNILWSCRKAHLLIGQFATGQVNEVEECLKTYGRHFELLL